jgi:hypothetical protein
MCGFAISGFAIMPSSAKAGTARPSEVTAASATTNLSMGFLQIRYANDKKRLRQRAWTMLEWAAVNVYFISRVLAAD